MLIGIDGNEANVGKRVGVNVWGFEILKSLAKIANKSENREHVKFIIYLSRPARRDLPEETENWKYRVIGPGRFWTRWRLPLDLYLHRPRPDVFLSLSHYAPKWAPCPRVVCIMDLSFLKFPEAFKLAVRWQLVNWTRESVKNAAHVITISEFNKREIIRNYGCKEEKITVVYPGVSEIFKGVSLPRQGDSLREKYGIGRKYLLFVGTRQPKKNLGRLIEAFGVVRRDFPDVELVIAGKIWGQFANMKDQIHPSSACGGLRTAEGSDPSGVCYVGYVQEADLPGLMAGAEALIIPSLYEGFGIPAAEAMAVGTPVLASDVSSLPEIVNGAGILFDPYDVKSIARAIEQLLCLKPTDRQRLVEKGRIQAKKFDWEKASENIIRSLLAVRPGDS